MKKTFNYLAIPSCLILVTTLAHADSDSSPGKMQEKMFKTMDTNADSRVTRDEFNDFLSKKFKELDVNNNGQITLEEMKGAYKNMEGSGRKKMNDSEMDSSGSAPPRDSANSKSETMAPSRSNNSCCWAPR